MHAPLTFVLVLAVNSNLRLAASRLLALFQSFVPSVSRSRVIGPLPRTRVRATSLNLRPMPCPTRDIQKRFVTVPAQDYHAILGSFRMDVAADSGPGATMPA
jgi:hypothetical protein